MMNKFLLFIIISLLLGTPLSARKGGLSRKLALAERIDLHLEAGGGILGLPVEDSLKNMYLFRIYPKALANQKALRRIPRKYRKLIGPEAYVGYLLWPSNFVYGTGNGNTLFITDWQPISLGLLSFPQKYPMKNMKFFKLTLPVSMAYKYFYDGLKGEHSVHIGLGFKGAAAFRILKRFSIKGTVQKFWFFDGDNKTNGDVVSFDPLYISGGIVLHFN